MLSHHYENWHAGRFRLVYNYFSSLHPVLCLEISGDFSQVKFISPVRQFWEKANSSMVCRQGMGKTGISFINSHLFTSHSLVQLLFPTVKLNGTSQPISIEYKMVHVLGQAVFIIQNFENLAVLDLFSFSYVLEQVSCVTLRDKNWIISLTATQK